jgi:transposase-like protein
MNPVCGMPTLRAVWTIVEKEDAAIEFLLERGAFYAHSCCTACGGNMSRRKKKLRCTKDGCRKSVSILAHSFFAQSRIAVNDCLLLGYLWITGASLSTALAMSGHSKPTIVDYFGFFRQLVTSTLDPEDTLVGGPNIVVQVDESKFGKRKNNRGSHREGAWVIGGIEQTEEKKFFLEVVDKRDADTIADVLERHVIDGSIVHSDCWRGYAGIESRMGVTHATVNHSVGFVNKENGVNTNSIEGKWAGLKRRITLRGRVRDKLGMYLFEQIWRFKHKNNLWEGFLAALRDIHY